MRPKIFTLLVLVLSSSILDLIQCSSQSENDDSSQSSQDTDSGPRVRRQRLNEDEDEPLAIPANHVLGNRREGTELTLDDLLASQESSSSNVFNLSPAFPFPENILPPVPVGSRHTYFTPHEMLLTEPRIAIRSRISQRFSTLPPSQFFREDDDLHSEDSTGSLNIPFTQPDQPPNWLSEDPRYPLPDLICSMRPRFNFHSQSSSSSHYDGRQSSLLDSELYSVPSILNSSNRDSTFTDNQSPTVFDVSDDALLPFIAQAAVDRAPGFGVRHGEYEDPISGNRLIVHLPVQTVVSAEFDDELEDDEQESKLDSTCAAHQSDSDETRMESRDASYSSPPRTSNVTPNYVYQTPVPIQNREASEPVCPPAPIIESIKLFGSRSSHRRKCSNNDRSVLSRKKRRINTCENFINRFNGLMALEPAAAQIHIDFPFQGEIIKSIKELELFTRLESLESEHLRAFEVRFDLFLRLVQKCPSRFFGPALALSLQYDQDFPKFLQLFYGVKDLWGYPRHSEVNLQKMIIILGLQMPVLSNAAFKFLTSTKNAAFFLPHNQSHPHYIGKFAHHLLALNLADYLKENFDARNTHFQANPLRSWILDFDYLAEINLHYKDRQFSELNLSVLYYVPLTFRNEREYPTALYKLIKTVISFDVSCLRTVQKTKQVRLLLSEASRQEDLFMIKSLFKNFDLESPLDHGVENRSQFSTVTVAVNRVNDGFCSVKLTFDGRHKLTLLLPLNL